MSAERWRSSRVCAGLHSAPVRRSVDKEIGATRGVEVIRLSPCRGVSRTFRTGRVARIRGGGLFWSVCKNLLEKFQKFRYMCPRDDKRRKQTESEVVGAVNQQTALHGFLYKRRAFDGKLDADHQAFGADCADEAELRGQFCQPFAQLLAASADIFEELFVFDGA